MIEFWLQATPDVDHIEALAVDAERSGWDGIQIADGRSGDVFVALTLAARATSTIRLATGVINPVARHPAVTASAIAGIARIAGDRVVLGVGRGDSSVRALGLRPSSVPEFEDALTQLQVFLRGERSHGAQVPWLAKSGGSKVPVDVAASGSRVIQCGARLAERVTLAVGAMPDRIREGLALAQRAAGRVTFVGAAIPIGLDDDPQVAAYKARGPASVTTHFQVRGGVRADAGTADAASRIDDVYDYDRHGRSDSPQAATVDAELLDRIAVAGSGPDCVAQVGPLVELGLDRLLFIVGMGDEPLAAMPQVADRIAREVLRQLRG